ncbi:hypothetical protein [Lactiplantibacillus brownii]
MGDDVSAWAIQAACEAMGYEDLSEVSGADYILIMDLAESMEGE